jgi:hypothetical protein
MEFIDLQTTLTVAVILTATAVIVCFDYLRKRRRAQQPYRVRTSVKISRTGPPRHSTRTFEPAPVDYTAAKKLAAERPLEPLVAVATPFRPPVEPRNDRETITVEVAPPSPAAPSGSSETPSPNTSLASLQTFTLPPFTIDAALWERLISSQPTRNLLSSADGDPQPIENTPPARGSHNAIEATYHMIHEHNQHLPAENQPSGMIQPPVLEKWLESEQRFTGLVVSIGINNSDSSVWHSRGLMQSVGSYIAGLLRARDYSCRTGYDEFVMVCPGEQGAQSQRRLNHISERLWDYQLRGIGACSILFSWGGVQVQDQPLAEAIASATERMRETKRSSNIKSVQAHRQAV